MSGCHPIPYGMEIFFWGLRTQDFHPASRASILGFYHLLPPGRSFQRGDDMRLRFGIERQKGRISKPSPYEEEMAQLKPCSFETPLSMKLIPNVIACSEEWRFLTERPRRTYAALYTPEGKTLQSLGLPWLESSACISSSLRKLSYIYILDHYISILSISCYFSVCMLLKAF